MNSKKTLIAKTVVVLDRITQSYDKALEAVRSSCRNFDFAEMKVSASLASGLQGKLRAVVQRVFAQFPLLLDTAISKDKTIWGTLVPFRFAMRPQRSGDVFIELAHVLAAAAPTSTHQTPGKRKGGGGKSQSHGQGGQDEDKMQPLANNMARTAESPLDPVSASMQQKELSTREHVLQRQGEGKGLAVHIHGNVYTSLDVRSPYTGENMDAAHDQDRRASVRRLGSMSSMYNNDGDEEGNESMPVLLLSARKPHISIIVDQSSTLKPGAELFTLMMGPRQLSDEISEMPFGTPDMLEQAAEAEAFFRKKNMPPLFSDHEKPGDFGDDMIQAEIAAVAEAVARRGRDIFKGGGGGGGGGGGAGDTDNEWDADFVQSIREQVDLQEKAAREEREASRQREREARQRDCPIFLQTAPGVKMLMQIPKVDVNLMLPALVCPPLFAFTCCCLYTP